jgi:hypothetical protein
MTQSSPKPVVWLGDTLATLRTCPQAEIELVRQRLKRAAELEQKREH